jgi:hypothetical protein
MASRNRGDPSSAADAGRTCAASSNAPRRLATRLVDYDVAAIRAPIIRLCVDWLPDRCRSIFASQEPVSPAVLRSRGGKATMSKHSGKSDFPVGQVRRYLEPGPIVLVSSKWQGMTNIMTMGWHTVMEFTPSLVGCVIASSNHSFQMIRASRECVINLPTTKLTD